MSGLQTLHGSFTWRCVCGAAMKTMGFTTITCSDCGRKWTLSGQVTLRYDDPPKPAEPEQVGPSLWPEEGGVRA